MPVLEETKLGAPQVKTSIANNNKPTTPIKTDVTVKKDENTTPKMSAAVSTSSQQLSK